jgi:hypothetical protein
VHGTPDSVPFGPVQNFDELRGFIGVISSNTVEPLHEIVVSRDFCHSIFQHDGD